MDIDGLTTVYGQPVTRKLIESKGIKLSEVGVFSPHNHVFENEQGSLCATTTIDELLHKLLNSPITSFSLTDHMTVGPAEILAKKIKRSKLKIGFIPGFEAKTQYDEFNVLGIKPEDARRILETQTNGKYLDHDLLIQEIKIHNEQPQYKDDQIVVGFNHPFSIPLIGATLGRAAKTLSFGKIKMREGFNFKQYIFDHWDERIEEDTTKSLNIDIYVANYLLDKNYTITNPEAQRKYAKHERIIQRLMADFDYIEFNLINFKYSDNLKALMLAEKYNKPILIGEDTHHPHQIGMGGFNLMPRGISLYEAITTERIIPVLAHTHQMNTQYPNLWSEPIRKDRGESSRIRSYRKA